jgi:hypothetical protein
LAAFFTTEDLVLFFENGLITASASELAQSSSDEGAGGMSDESESLPRLERLFLAEA